MAASERSRLTLMLLACSLILTMALGLRHTFGLFLQPMSADNGWGREVFGFAIALQNLLWGLSQPFTGMVADLQVVYDLGRRLADSREWPQWKPGSEFKAARDRTAAQRMGAGK